MPHGCAAGTRTREAGLAPLMKLGVEPTAPAYGCDSATGTPNLNIVEDG